MRLVLLILLTMLPVVAHAAPVFVAIAAAIGVEVTTVVLVFQIGLTVAMSVYGSAKRRRMIRKARDEYNANLQDRMVTRIATDSPLRYVYGRTRVGSDIVAMFPSGDRDQYKHLVCVHAAHECDGIEEIYINGKALGTLDGSGGVTGGDFLKTETKQYREYFSGTTVTLAHTPKDGQVRIVKDNGGDNGSDFVAPSSVVGNVVTLPVDVGLVAAEYTYTETTPRVRVQKHLGTPTDPADAYLIAQVPSKWTSAHVLRGLCYTVVTLDLDEPEFQGGPPSVEVLMRGALLYDFRTGTTGWSENPALAIYHYLTSDMCGIPASDLPLDKFITAANVCDESFGALKKYVISGSVSADQPQPQVLEEMADCMAGNIVSTTWDITAGKYVAPVMSLVVDDGSGYGDVVGPIAITPGVSEADLFNGVRGQFVDADSGNIATDFPPYQNSTYVAADGRELWLDKSFPFTSRAGHVHNLCRIMTEQQRNGYTVKASFSLKAWKLKVDDRITLDSALFGWTGKVFVVLDKRYAPGSAAVELTLKEDAAEIWDYADAVTVDATPNTDLPNPYAIAPLASLTCASGGDQLLAMSDGTVVSRIKVSWPLATTQAVVTNGLIEVEWMEVTSGITTWQTAQVTGDSLEAFLSPVKDKAIYVVRARTVNPYLNVKSDWSYTYHRVIGKTAPPPDVTGFAVSVLTDATRRFAFDTANQPADVRSGGGYRIKYRAAGSGTAWASMTALHTGLVTQSPFETNAPAAGDYDFAIAAVDSSGNESLNATLALAVTITDASIAATALLNAASAQAAADAANTAITNIADDNLLTRGEKPDLIRVVNTLIDEFVKNRLQADSLSVSRTDYDKAFWALYDYLGTLAPSYDNLAADTVIVGATLRQKFASLYAARQVMLNAISTKASTLATWSGVVASSGKLSTGSDIFNGGAIGTGDIANEAVTEILSTVVTNVAITPNSDVPTMIASFNYTPTVSGVVIVSLTGTFTAASTGASPSFYLSSGVYLHQSVTGTDSPILDDIFDPVFSSLRAFTRKYAFTVTAGTAYTFSALGWAKTNIANYNITSAELIFEAIKK